MAPVRVLHVLIGLYPGGIESMLMNIYRNIDREKIQFDFLLHLKEKTFFEDEIESLGGKIHRVKPLKINNLNSYKKELDTFFKQHNYKIVHSHIYFWSYFNLKVAKANHIPVRIAHSHIANTSIWNDGAFRMPLVLILKQLINKPLTHRFACGEAAGKWLFGNHSFKVLANAIDSEQFVYHPEKADKIKEELGLKGKKVFGNVARFDIQKNHKFLISFFAELLQDVPDAHLLLVGDGELRAEIEDQVQELGIESSVSFLGLRKDIANLLQAMDYFLLPSLFEGLPVSLIEAQASSLKIFASDRITKEMNITNEIVFLGIENTKTWVDAIKDNLVYERKNNQAAIIEAGYDIHSNVKMLTDFYLNHYNN